MLIVIYLLLILSLSAIGFYGYSIYAAVGFFRPNSDTLDFHPPITILKPVCGLDDNAYKNLTSFCHQDYPQYQIIFGIRDELDLSIAVVKQIIKDFPDLDIELMISDRTIGTNLKVSNLANMEPIAKYPLLLLADSDIRVRPDYLKQVVQPLVDPANGVVTCLYRSLPRGWMATLEALWTATGFHPSVLVARKLEGVKFALGSTIVIRRAVLEAIGGFPVIADYLADDFQLGNLATQIGYKVILSNYVVEHVLTTETLTDFVCHQTRWACCNRVSRPWGYLGLIFTHGTATSLLFLLATEGSVLGWAVLSLTWFTRIVMGWVIGVRHLKDPVVKKFLWLMPLCDLISFVVWCYSFTCNSIRWRGQRFLLTQEGKLLPLKTISKPHNIALDKQTT